MDGALRRDHEARSEEAVVTRGVVLAAELLRPNVGLRRSVQRVGAVVDRADVVARILEEAADEGVRRRDHPRELRRAEVRRGVGVRLLSEVRPLLGDRLLRRVLDAVVGAEEPEMVLQDVAAEGGAEVELVEPLERPEVRLVLVLVVRLQRVVVVIDERLAVVVVAAGLRDDVDDAAGRAAVLGLVPARLDVELLDELVVELLALRAVLDAIRQNAVDHEGVLESRRAVDGDRVRERGGRGRLGRDARRDLHDRRVVAAARKRLDLPVVDVGRQAARALVHDRRLGGDEDLLLDGGAQTEVGRGGLPESDRDRLLDPGEARERRGDLVDAGRQQDQAERPGRVGDVGPHALERGASGLYGRARERTPLLVGDPPDDVPGGLRETESGGEERQRQKRRREGTCACDLPTNFPGS